MGDNYNELNELKNEVLVLSEALAGPQEEAFFEIYSEIARENGEIENIEYCYAFHVGPPSYGIDGYHLNKESGELVLVVSNYHSDNKKQILNQADVLKLFKRVDRFFDKTYNAKFLDMLEESSPMFQAAYFINKNIKYVKRVKVILFSNAILSVRSDLKKITIENRNGIKFTRSILDFDRYISIQKSKTASDPIEINFKEEGLQPLPCLYASESSKNYESYLAVISGEVLANIYRHYGARLLEANVRTFLQARTKVNKGIINTIEKEPQNFFAYNNGLTATASQVFIETNEKGSFIVKISDLQIVNGGQTTASILYSADVRKTDLKNVYIQMKLSRAQPEVQEELIPNISLYANSQNKVTAADLFSSHPFHKQMEKLSRRVLAPPREGFLAGTKWFYERARGQYRDEQSYMTPSKKKAFQRVYPKSQHIVKTDLAKYEMMFGLKPYIVCLGAGKFFSTFADIIDKKWDTGAKQFGEVFFKSAMSRAMIFKWTDKHIAKSDWYLANRGYKSQIVAYTVSVLNHCIINEKSEIDFLKLWTEQDLPQSMKKLIKVLAPKVANILTKPPPENRNVTEYCKRQYCWTAVISHINFSAKEVIGDCLVSKERAKEIKKDGIKLQKIDNGIDAQTKVVELSSEWENIESFGQRHRLVKAKEYRYLASAKKIKTKGQIPQEFECLELMSLFNRVVQAGYKPKVNI